MTPKEKVENLKVNKPDALFYAAIRFILLVKSKLNRTKFYFHFDKNKFKDKQIILILDHSGRDSYMAGLSNYHGKKFNIVIGYHNVFVKFLFTPLMKIGVIPKKLFLKDLKATRNILRAIEMGNNIAIFVEGMQSIYGKNMAITPGTISLIKKAKLPVILCKSYGAYLRLPDYSRVQRKGKNEYHYEVLFTKEDVNKYSENELYDILFDRFKYNDFTWNENRNNRYISKVPVTYKLTNLLYLCPKCKSEFSLIEEKDGITCRCCNNKIKIDDTYKLSVEGDNLSFHDIPTWVEFEKEEARKEILESDFEISYDSYLDNLNREKLKFSFRKRVGEGKVILNKDGIFYSGFINNNQANLKFDIKDVPLYTASMGDCNYLMTNDDMFIFVPKENRNRVIKYMFLEEALYNKIDKTWEKVRNDVISK